MIKIVFLITSCKKSGPIQQMLNIIKYLDKKTFEPILITIYPEDTAQSQLHLYTPYVKHIFVPTSKLDVITGHDISLRHTLNQLKPDIIHSLGVFPDYAVSRMKKWKQIITLRNYIYDDYPAKFGKLKGMILAKLHYYAIKHAKKVVACSKSLAQIYHDKLGLTYNYVRNGIDLKYYTQASAIEKQTIRQEMSLPKDAFIFVYTGQLIERKNIDFLLNSFSQTFKDNPKIYLLVLGGGELYQKLKEKYKQIKNINFRGNVMDVHHYLKACDAYISASKSEGLPNGVLEAMATGLPFILSDIEQHLEIYNVNPNAGYVFPQNNESKLIQQMNMLMKQNHLNMGEKAYQTVYKNFNAVHTSKIYQNLYLQLTSAPTKQ